MILVFRIFHAFVLSSILFIVTPNSQANTANQTVGSSATDNSWLIKVKQDLEKKEYQASINKKGLQTPNRAHNFRIYYTEKGIQVYDRMAKDEPLLMGMRLQQYGRDGHVKKIKTTKPTYQGPRVEYRYTSSISEWYDNSPKGLEHGFQLLLLINT